MSRTIADLSNDLVKVAHNPAAMARAVINELERGGIELLTTNDPFVYAVQSTVMTGHATMMKIDQVLPKVFASMANNEEDVYRHMSDKDTANVFARPGSCKFIWVFDYDQIKNKAPYIDGSTTRKATIPVNTEYVAKGTVHSQPYPIDIRFLENDGVQVQWDMSHDNPFTTLVNPELSFTINRTNYGGVDRRLLAITVTVEQYSVNKFVSTLVPGVVWKETYALTDQFYTVRASHFRGGKWHTLNRALSIETIDPLEPTIVIKKVTGGVELIIPEVYTNSDLVSGELIVELVETKGALNDSYENYNNVDFSYTFKDNLGVSNSLYTNVLKIVDVSLVSVDALSGGRDALTMLELRDRVIDNTLGNVKIPVTDDALEAALKDKGYSVTKAIDSLTDLVYLAATDLPSSNSQTLTGPIGTVSTPVVFSKELMDNHRSIRQNDYRYTITPDTLFRIWSSNIGVYENLTLKELRGVKHIDKIEMLSDMHLLSIPYHLVVDLNNEFVEARGYKLDEPKVLSRSIKTTNDTVPYIVNSIGHQLSVTDAGFKLTIESAFNQAYAEVEGERLSTYLGLATETGMNYIEGTVAGVTDEGNYIWEWVIETNLDIDRNNQIIITNLRNQNGGIYNQAIDLASKFTITYGVMGTPTEDQYSTIDDYLPPTFQGLGITLEDIELKLGDPLKHLWANARPLPGSYKYKKYEEDVPATYTTDVLISDGKGGWEYDIVDGEIVFRKEHYAGDPIYEEDGTQRIRYEKGSIVYENGKPVIDDTTDISIEIDVWLADTRYLLATTSEVIDYNKRWKQHMDSQTLVTLPELAKSTLGRTSIALTTKNTIGKIKVMLENELETYISAAQQFTVTFYVEDTVRKDQEAISQIKRTTNQTIYKYLSNTDIVSTNGIGKALMEALSYTVKDIVVDPLVGAQDSRYFKILDNEGKAGVAKRLRLAGDGELTLEDDITTTFLKYTK